MSERCCANCFSDVTIKAKIEKEGVLGRCKYCGAQKVTCLDVKFLADKLEIFLYRLIEDEAGENFSEILSLYGIFSESIKQKDKFVFDVFGYDVDKKYAFSFDSGSYQNQWEGFKEEIKHGNRFFPRAEIFSSLFGRGVEDGEAVFYQLLEQLKITINTDDCMYRARISEDKLGAEQMSCPPKEKVTGGRANPVGIPYLYLAENIKTCISEVRPNNTSKISVSKFKPVSELSVLDLTDPRKMCSAATFEEEQLEAVLGYLNLLEKFSSELSRPIRPESSHLDYIPTQFLCEFIKTVPGIDGLVFNSSLSDGKNYVFFLEEKLKAEEPFLYGVTRIEHSYEELK
ncbi:RES domain-containing protein [Kushneria sp. Sum13]|uniref:RES domain-containing protein n=1 Tax=Kushneria sp. Sum13 TaxID=3459196 RepID=UPI0040453A5B